MQGDSRGILKLILPLVLYWGLFWMLPTVIFTYAHNAGQDPAYHRLIPPITVILFQVVAAGLIFFLTKLATTVKRVWQRVWGVFGVYWLTVWIIPMVTVDVFYWFEGTYRAWGFPFPSWTWVLNVFLIGPLLIILPRAIILEAVPALRKERGKRFLLIYGLGIFLPLGLSFLVPVLLFPHFPKYG